jgi:hypothetical protein
LEAQAARLSYFATRVITDDSTGIKTFTEAPGLAENGKVALRTFLRADSKVLWTERVHRVRLFKSATTAENLNGNRKRRPRSSGPLLSPGTEVTGLNQVTFLPTTSTWPATS